MVFSRNLNRKWFLNWILGATLCGTGAFFFVTWFLQARRAPPLRISVVFRLPFECVLFDLGVHFGHCRIPPRDHFGIELQEFFWKLFIIRRCYLHVSLTPATQSVHHPSSLHHPPSVWELICKSESPSLERKGRRNSRRDNNLKSEEEKKGRRIYTLDRKGRRIIWPHCGINEP